MGEVSWKIWAIRLTISSVLTGAIAYGISFKVADYVVKANTSSIETTLRAMMDADQRASDSAKEVLTQINNTLQITNSELNGIRTAIGDLQQESTTQIQEIAFIRRDLGRVEKAVQEAGIDIQAMSKDTFDYDGKLGMADWTSIRSQYGVGEDEPLFLVVSPKVEFMDK